MAPAYRIAIGVSIDASQAKAGSSETRSAVASIKQEAEATKPALDALATSIDKADKAGGAGVARKGIDEIGEAADRTETKIQRLINRSVGLHTGAANENVRQWTGALAAEGLAVDNLRAKYDPAFAAITRYKQAVLEMRMAHAQGQLSSEKMAQAMSRERQATLASLSAIKGRNQAVGGGGLRPDQRSNLYMQGVDTVQSLALGMPPIQVLLQQGPQIAQVYGSIGGAARAALGVLTPLNLAIGGTVAVVAGAGMALSSYLGSIKEVETAAAGLGKTTAGTADAMELAAERGAATAAISVSSARSMEAQFLKTGQIASSNFEQLIGISKDFAATFGIAADEAGEQLAQLFSDPAKAADDLYRQYGLISGATASYVKQLADQNRQSEAQKVLLEALPSRLASASEATTLLGRTWDNVARSMSNAYDWAGKTINRIIEGPTRNEQIDALKGRVENAGPGFLETTRARQLREAQEARDRAELSKLQVDRVREREEAARMADLQTRARPGVMATDISDQSQATAYQRMRRQLENDIKALQAGAGSPLLGDGKADQIAASIDAKTRALQTMIPAQERANQLAALETQIQTERNPIARADLEARRRRVELAGEEITSAQAETQITAARNQALQQFMSVAQAQSAQIADEVTIRRQLNDEVAAGNITAAEAEARLRTEIQLRPLATAAAAAQGDEQRRLTALLEEARAAQAAMETETRRSGAIEVARGQADTLEKLKLETSLVGASVAEREKAVALLETEQMIRARGFSSLSAEAEAIRRNARAIAESTEELHRHEEAWQTVQSAGSNAIDNIIGSLTKGDLKGVLNGLLGDISSFFSELAGNSIKNSLFKTNLPTIGTVFDTLAGRASASTPAATATSTAAATISQAATMTAPVIPVTRSALAPATDVEAFIRQWAPQYGIDANTAVNVARSEGGLNSWNMQSGIFKNGVQEPSYGPFQLYKGGGLGNVFQKQTGLDPAIAANGPEATKFALDYASKNGWGSWYGAGRVGIGNWEGINKGGGADAFAALDKVAASGDQAAATIGNLGSVTTTTTQGLGTLNNGLNNVGSSLSSAASATPASGGSGGGLFGWLGSLFGGGGATTPVDPWAGLRMAGGGDVSGPGTSTSDSIPAMLSDGEFVVNARATALHRPLLRAINNGKVLALASGGDVRRGSMIGSAAPVYDLPRAGRSGSSSGERSGLRDIVVNVDNPQGDRSITEAVNKGVREGLKQYDAILPERIKNIKERPLVRGPR